jgi:hypothetical protein
MELSPVVPEHVSPGLSLKPTEETVASVANCRYETIVLDLLLTAVIGIAALLVGGPVTALVAIAAVRPIRAVLAG